MASKFRLIAEVIRRKKILLSNPDLQNMNETQWVFELEGLYSGEEKKYEDIMDIFKLSKKTLVALFGLNMMPISETVGEDELGGSIIKLRPATEDEFIPLSMLCGRREIVSEIANKLEEMDTQHELDIAEEEGSLSDLESAERLMDMAKAKQDADIEFLDGPEGFKKYMAMQDPLNRHILQTMVRPLSEANEVYEEEEQVVKIQPKRRSKVTVE